MDNLFNFNLFSDSDKYNKLSKNQVNKKFDEFIKESFANYIYKSAIFNKYAKVYDQDSTFTEECSDIYILSEQLYLNAIKKIQVPFDVKFNKSNNLYIFNLDDIHNSDFIFKDSANGRIFRPKKQKYLCKIIALVFVKLYILIKGIYTTFNHNLTYQEFISSKHKSKSIQSSEEPSLLTSDISSEDLEEIPELSYEENPPSEELSSLSNQISSNNTHQQGGGIIDNIRNGGIIDNIRNFFTGNKDNESDDENDSDEIYEKELSYNEEEEKEEKEKEKEEEEEEEEKEKEEEIDEDELEKDYDYDNNSIDANKDKKSKKKIKYNNIFFAFINSIFASDIHEHESKLDMEFPPNLEDLIRNLNNSGIIDIICDTDYIYNCFKKNILFNPNNMNKVYESSPKILKRIKNIETEMLKEYETKLNDKDKELHKLFREFEIYNKLCNKLLTNFSVKDESRIYERVIKIVKTMFTNYTNNRNKLFDSIILKIFEFKDKIIKDENGKVKEVKNNIIKIKDNITYKEIIKLTTNAKIIIYDLHIDFFKNLKEIFSLLNEKGVIKFDKNQYYSDSINKQQSKEDDNSIEKLSPVLSADSSPVLSPDSSPVLSPDSSPVLSADSSPVLSPDSSPVLSPESSPGLSPDSSPVLSSESSPILSPGSLNQNSNTSVDTPFTAPIESAPANTPVDTPVDTSVDTPVDTSVDTPVDTSVDTSVNKPVDTSVNKPVDTSVNTSVDTYVNTPIDTPVNTQAELSSPTITSQKSVIDNNGINLNNQTVSPAVEPKLETNKGGKKSKKRRKSKRIKSKRRRTKRR